MFQNVSSGQSIRYCALIIPRFENKRLLFSVHKHELRLQSSISKKPSVLF